MKRILSLLLTFSMLLSLTLLIGCNNGDADPSNQQSAAKPASDGLELTLSEDQAYYTVTGIGTCTDTEIVISSTYEGKPVKKIGGGAFKVAAATTLHAGAGAKNKAYKNTLTVGDAPELAITSVILSTSITEIGDEAFYGCTGITMLDLSIAGIFLDNEAFRGLPTSATVSVNRAIAQIEVDAFWQLTAIRYRGTVKDWSAVNANVDANFYPFPVIYCTDGVIGE